MELPEILDLEKIRREAYNDLGLCLGDRIEVDNGWHTSSGIVTSINFEGIFYLIDKEAHSYGWARPVYGDKIRKIGSAPPKDGLGPYPPLKPREEMADLHELKKSISEMSDEELEHLIRGDRANRRGTAANAKAKAVEVNTEKVAKPKKAPKPATDFNALIASMSPEERAALLKDLEGEDL
jgi:hypothetical protein